MNVDNQKENLSSQLRNEYGKVIYTYTAHWKDIDIISRIIDGENEGTLFLAHKSEDFNLIDFL